MGWARNSCRDMVFVDERFVAKAVMCKGLRLDPGGKSGRNAEASQVARELHRLQTVEHNTAKVGMKDPDADFKLSRWRHLSKMWASELLLDARPQDEDSRHFKVMWMVFVAVSLLA